MPFRLSESITDRREYLRDWSNQALGKPRQAGRQHTGWSVCVGFAEDPFSRAAAQETNEKNIADNVGSYYFGFGGYVE
jgi:hypothetical protein